VAGAPCLVCFRYLSGSRGRAWTYAVVFCPSFGEAVILIGLVVPGSIVVVTAGFLASRGVIDVGDLFVVAALGAILGDSFSFYLGRRGLVSFRQDNVIFKPSMLVRGKKYFKRHGARSVFWGRFIGWFRPVVPFIAGVFQLDTVTFLIWNILSGMLWAAAHVALGYFLGQAWQAAAWIWLTGTVSSLSSL
jgi:membrane protein DedA with SNARE-associated domain